jgi:superfamily II DNA or RNA helicase
VKSTRVEGIDVPEVNIAVFLRCKHSCRIFLQQLSRGLRISDAKDRVQVMDFVADIRRIAEIADIADLEREVARAPWERKDIHLRGSKIMFTNQRALPLIKERLKGIDDLAENENDARINFPVFDF